MLAFMNRRAISALLCVFFPAGLTLARLTSGTNPASTAGAMAEARQFRAALAAEVSARSVTPEEAMERLRTAPTRSGLSLDAEADFATAALDIGQRLVASGHPSQAEPFFRAAEESLAAAVQRMAGSAAREKSMLLQQLAVVREKFLGKRTEAKAALDEAAALDPGNRDLQRKRDELAGELDLITKSRTPKG